MKKIFLLIVLVVGFISAFAQSDDSTKYIYYRYTYGNRMPRFRTDSIQTIPRDTAHNANYGSVAIKNNLFYIKDSTKWTQASADLSVLPYVTWENKSGFDSLALWRPTPKELRIKAIRINGATKVVTDTTIDYTVTPGFTNPMTTAGDIIYGLAAGAAQRLGAGTSTQTLHGGTVPSWGSVNLTLDVGGTLQIGNGGTGQGTANNALNALLPSQTGNATKYLQTDGTNTSWQAAAGGGSPNANIGTAFRWLHAGTQEIRTVANGYGINWDSTSTTNSLTGKVDTSTVSTKTFVTNIRNYPNEKRLGILYERGTWDSTLIKEFIPTGTATITLNGNKPVFSQSVIDYNNWVILRNIPTGLNYWKARWDVKIVSGGTWVGPGIKSLVTHDGANFGVMGFTAYNTGTNQFIYDEVGGTQYATGTAPARSIGDILELTTERKDTTISFTVRNQTTNSSAVTITYNYPSNQSVPVPNVGTWGLMLSGTAGSVELQYLKIESDEWQYPTLFLLGNSKLAVGYGDSWIQRVGEKLNTNFPHTVFSAGSAERLSDMWFKLKETQRFDAQQFICYDCWSNSTRAAVSTAAVVDTLQRMWEMITNGGGSFKFVAIPEDSTVNGASGLTAVKNWIVANHSADNIDVWTTLGGGTNKLLLTYAHSGADKVHLNQAGQDVIYNAIVASTQITTVATNRRAPYRVFSPELTAIGDSLTFLYPIIPVSNKLLKFDPKYRIVPSLFDDNGATALVSTQTSPTRPAATSTFRLLIDGPLGVFGNTGQINLFDRTNPNNSFYKYSDANIMRFGFNTGGGAPAELTTMDLAGKWRISPITTGVYRSSFMISQNYNFNYGPNREGFGFNSAYAAHGYLSATALGDISTNSFFSHTFYANGATTYGNNATVWIEGPPKDSTNVTSSTPLSLEVGTGNTLLGGNLLQSASAYHNFGTTFGTSGYGFRDNAGVMQAKNSGGAWADLPTSGSYTPTLTGVANVAASTSAVCYYYRIGTEVTVYGTLQIDPTAATTLTQIGLSIPVASTFTTSTQAAGTFAFNNGEAGIVISDASNGRAELQFTPTTGTNRTYWFQFSYHVQ